jgi:hypothetical protein
MYLNSILLTVAIHELEGSYSATQTKVQQANKETIKCEGIFYITMIISIIYMKEYIY